LLSIAFLSSCVKLPRQYVHAGDQTAPLVSGRGATNAPLININTASVEELEKLPGIGKGLSERIIAYRKEYGRFRRPEHLMMVRGISTRRFLAMQALITTE
jgi:competence protein ComEA